MSTALHQFASLLHPPLGEHYTELPVTRDGVRLVPDGKLVEAVTNAFFEIRIRNNRTRAESRGICGVVPATAFLDGSVRPHEKTLLSRLQRQETTVLADNGALGKPVLLTAPSLEKLWLEVDNKYIAAEESVYFEGNNHTYELRALRARSNDGSFGALETVFSLTDLSLLVIADGHHRAATHALLSAKGETACNHLPVCIIGGDELTIGAFTRVITDGRSPEELLPLLHPFFQSERVEKPEAPTQTGEWLLSCNNTYYRLTRKPNHDESIDSEWLDHTVLPDVFNIKDTRADERISFDPTPDPENGLLVFASAKGKTYLCGFPLPVQTFFEEVKAGHCLPPKSTRFEPRIPSGLVVFKP